MVAAVPLLLAALLLAPGAVWAQSGTLISNLGQSASSWHDIPGNCLAAQRFTTGSFADGYLITSVDVVSYDAEGDVFDVEVRPLGSDGRPSSTTLFTLTNPSSFAAGTLNFRSAGNTNVLQPDTSYAVLINSRSRDVSVGTTLGNEDAGGATGWSIADELSAQAQVGWTGPGIAGLALRIAVNGRENTGSGEPHLLTARFEDVPASHNGSDRFTFNVAFSHDITITRAENLQAHFRNHALDVTYGTVKRARRVDGRSDLWKITIEPDFETHQLGFYDDVTIVLPANRSCDAIGGICTADGKKLSNRVEAIVPMESRDDTLPALSVADAEATEGEDNALDFVVTLDPAADGQVTVDYATADGTATGGADYTDTSGTMTFDAGETRKTVAVPIAEDTEEEGGETVTLTLSNASGATLVAASATGTIRNAGVANTAGDGGAGHQRDGAGGQDADGVGVGHLRRRRAGQCELRLSVDPRKQRHSGRDRLQLHAGERRRRRADQGPRQLYRRRRQHGKPHQRGDRSRRGAARAADGRLQRRAGRAHRREVHFRPDVQRRTRRRVPGVA